MLLANTWGDGLYLVFDNAGQAARCALDLQAAMAAIDLADAGLPDHLALRIGGHLGPVYAGRDPIMKQNNFFGAHVSRAARIEPVTPEGCVYVTETLAAVLAIHNAAEFACDYVGMTEVSETLRGDADVPAAPHRAIAAARAAVAEFPSNRGNREVSSAFPCRNSKLSLQVNGLITARRKHSNWEIPTG